MVAAGQNGSEEDTDETWWLRGLAFLLLSVEPWGNKELVLRTSICGALVTVAGWHSRTAAAWPAL
jgi:hypothetical protein